MLKEKLYEFFAILILATVISFPANSQTEIFAQMGYEEGADGIILLTHKCTGDIYGELKVAVLRKNGKVIEGCYVINDRKNPVVKWSTGRIEELDIKKFSKHLENIEPDADVLKISTECKSMYQARVFNYFLENICSYKGGVAQKLGVAAKNICGNEMSEPARKTLSNEVKQVIQGDIEKMGQSKFCQNNKQGYLDLTK